MLNIKRIKINHLQQPWGICGEIRTGWEIESDKRNVFQSAYRIQIGESPDFGTLIYYCLRK
ncbi:hypothetical protein D7X87_03075 [bacterium D16-54]|nr:hypothetical protein D7X87_03075 [bacterium D16-54]RKJ16606.1 hypothetical protein D7X65_03070 [bacterium D16-56]